jgi:hypothetical protein
MMTRIIGGDDRKLITLFTGLLMSILLYYNMPSIVAFAAECSAAAKAQLASAFSSMKDNSNSSFSSMYNSLNGKANLYCRTESDGGSSFNASTNTIYISENVMSKGTATTISYIMHEGTHKGDWTTGYYTNTNYGRNLTELHAWKVQAQALKDQGITSGIMPNNYLANQDLCSQYHTTANYYRTNYNSTYGMSDCSYYSMFANLGCQW